jgi:hypothetical protein
MIVLYYFAIKSDDLSPKPPDKPDGGFFVILVQIRKREPAAQSAGFKPKPFE